MKTYIDHTVEEVDSLVCKSALAFKQYRNTSLLQRQQLLHQIADELEAIREELVQTAHQETNLPLTRLNGELDRTKFQLTSYADAAVKGWWLHASIDTADNTKTPAKPDIRKTMMPLGVVAVFGASNFPFAYSTAGGDTASALAAGCTVIVKAHPAHAETSTLAAEAIQKAVKKCHLPEDVFIHVYGAATAVGEALVKHEALAAVGFTGSFGGGKALFDWAQQRKNPIPVFAEMGSVNPVFILPEKLQAEPEDIAKKYAASITQGVGQFCTNPGLIIGVEGEALDIFISTLGKLITQQKTEPMLHKGIAKAFAEKRERAIMQAGVFVAGTSTTGANDITAIPTIAVTSGKVFLTNTILHEEVFGPYSIVVACSNATEMQQIAEALEGQITTTILGTDDDISKHLALIDTLQQKCGRIIFNGVPTGVEVCLSMQHGGPFPATTDSRFTSVGADAIKRFARPLAFQNWPNKLLPPALQNDNPLNIFRIVNNELTAKEL